MRLVADRDFGMSLTGEMELAHQEMGHGHLREYDKRVYAGFSVRMAGSLYSARIPSVCQSGLSLKLSQHPLSGESLYQECRVKSSKPLARV